MAAGSSQCQTRLEHRPLDTDDVALLYVSILMSLFESSSP